MIEVLYMRYFTPRVAECDSLEGARSFIEFGVDDGQMASVGILVDGEPHTWDGYLTQEPPTDEQAASMRDLYVKAER